MRLLSSEEHPHVNQRLLTSNQFHSLTLTRPWSTSTYCNSMCFCRRFLVVSKLAVSVFVFSLMFQWISMPIATGDLPKETHLPLVSWFNTIFCFMFGFQPLKQLNTDSWQSQGCELAPQRQETWCFSLNRSALCRYTGTPRKFNIVIENGGWEIIFPSEGNFLWAILVLGMVSSLVLDTCFSSQDPFVFFHLRGFHHFFGSPRPIFHRPSTKSGHSKCSCQSNKIMKIINKKNKPPGHLGLFKVRCTSKISSVGFERQRCFCFLQLQWDATLSLSVSLSINSDRKEGYPSLTMYILERILWV